MSPRRASTSPQRSRDGSPVATRIPKTLNKYQVNRAQIRLESPSHRAGSSSVNSRTSYGSKKKTTTKAIGTSSTAKPKYQTPGLNLASSRGAITPKAKATAPMRFKQASSFYSNTSATPRSAGRLSSSEKKQPAITSSRRPATTKLTPAAKRQPRIGVEVTLTTRAQEKDVHEALLQNNLSHLVQRVFSENSQFNSNLRNSNIYMNYEMSNDDFKTFL